MKKSKSKSESRVLNTIILLTALALIVGLFILGLQIVSNVTGSSNSKFNENVVINGVNVKGLTKKEAESKINRILKNKVDNINVRLSYKDKEWVFDRDDLEVNTSVHTVIDDAYRYSQLNSSSEEAVKFITDQGYEFRVAFNQIFINFYKKQDSIKAEIETAPINSEVEFLPDSVEVFKISKSQNGLKVNTEKLYKEIEKQFDVGGKINVEIEMQCEEPEKDDGYYNGKLELLGEFSTFCYS